MADIFLSYSSKDKERVKPLVQALEREGWAVWWDQELLIGVNYRKMIQEKLEDSKCVLVVWSESSIDAEWVHEEADYAKNNSHLFPAIIDQVKIPLGFGMRQTVNLVGWTGYSTHTEFQKLVQSIKEKIGVTKQKTTTPHPEPPVKPIAKKNKSENSRPESRILAPTPVTRTIRLPDGKKIQFEMVDLPGGEFQMGGTKNDEKPIHQVRVPPFSIGKYQVTQAQWQAVMGANPSHFKGETRPVESVSWNDTQQFLRKIGNGFRLPTEAEWEYAARGGTTTEYSFGDDASKLGEYAWFGRNRLFGGNAKGETHPVGEKKPNPFGLYDMHGNVWEWVEDHWHKNYEGAPTDGSAWITGDNNALRVLRGGSWYNSNTTSSVPPTASTSAPRTSASALSVFVL